MVPVAVPYASASATAGGITISGASPVAVSDNFNRANGALGANWTAITGRTAPTISSNRVTGSDQAARWSADAFAAAHYSEVSCAPSSNYPSHFLSACAAVRCQSAANEFILGSMCPYDDGEGTAGCELRIYDTKGVATLAATDMGDSSFPGSNPILRLEVSGNTVTLKTAATHGGTYTTRLTGTIVSGLTGGGAGIYVSGTDDFLDSWYGGDL
jgi:hypothetical protein